MNVNKIGLLKIFGVMLVFILAVWAVAAVPTGPSNINVGASSRYSVASASSASAIAGNVTELIFQANSVTQTWQGYYGNISGSIKLGDSNNNTLYDWTAASPNGEIYATRASGTPTWASIACATTAQTDTEDLALNVNSVVDQDAVGRTFLNTTSFNAFYVGNVNINTSQDCKAVQLYNGSVAPSSDFQEVLLHDGSSLIYTAVIKQNANGFDNNTHDFEMIVGEDGHNGDSTATPYYFYVELG